MKKLKFLIMLLAVVPMLMTGCKKNKSGQTSTVKFNITDAPADFDALNIDVQGVQVHTQADGWVTLSSSLGTINILNYVNGSSTLVAQGDISAGTIDQVRLMLGSDNSVVVNGNSFSLGASGTGQAGLTLDLNGQLQAGNTYNFTIDFDASQSVSGSGGGSFQFTPTIRLICDSLMASGSASGSGSINVGGSGSGSINVGGGGSTGGSTTGSGSVVINGSGTGNITGSISPAGLASVCVSGPNGSSICTMTDLSGHFTLQAVGSGSYSLTITPTLPILSAHTLSNISVSAGQTTNIGVVTM